MGTTSDKLARIVATKTALANVKYIFHKKSYKFIQTCMLVFIKNTKNCILNVIQ